MKNTFGSSLFVTIAGESHGEALTVIIDGLTPGVEVSTKSIENALSLRRPAGKISTARRESDEFSITSGVFNGKATGAPLCITIKNSDTRSADYGKAGTLCRPGHADFTANEKYHGHQDHRGGGHFSGRITAALVAVGAICRDILLSKGITLATHISACGGVSDRSFGDYGKDFDYLSDKSFPVLCPDAEEKMKSAISNAAEDHDSVGGILETAVIGLPTGVGEPWFDSFESILSHILFSVPAVKGIEFGAGFAFAEMRGSQANDSFKNENGKIITETNNNGGINGGITNGMPIIFRCAVKPTPSISKEQATVALDTRENTVISVGGRHDPCIVHRAAAVVNACTAIAVLDMLYGRYGTDLNGI